MPTLGQVYEKITTADYQFDRVNKECAVYSISDILNDDIAPVITNVFFLNNLYITETITTDTYITQIFRLTPQRFNELFSPTGELNLFRFQDFDTTDLEVRFCGEFVFFLNLGFNFPGTDIPAEMDMNKRIIARLSDFIIVRAEADFKISDTPNGIPLESEGSVETNLIQVGPDVKVRIPKRFRRIGDGSELFDLGFGQ